MDPALIGALVAPIQAGRADYVKQPVHGLQGLDAMPPLRLFGNAALRSRESLNRLLAAV